MPIQPNSSVRYYKYRPGRWEAVNSRVIREMPVSLTVNGEVWLTFMCTPTDLEGLAAGFLFNEGVIDSADEIANLSVCASGDNVDVWLNHAVEKPAVWKRTTGCSGGVTAADPKPAQQAIHRGEVLPPEVIFDLMGQLLSTQELYKSTRGVHASALSDGQKVVVLAEDIGRHNTLDKIAGRCLLDRVQIDRRILLTTGRISTEMLQKAARIGASILISRTAPNAASIQSAEEAGITLIGYARRDQFQLYTHPERIAGAPAEAHFPLALIYQDDPAGPD